MASADFWRRLRAPLDARSQRHTARSPRVLRTLCHAYARRIYVVACRTRIGLCISLPAHPTTPPLSASCSSRQRFASGFLQTSSHPDRPCRAANGSPCRVRRGLSSPRRCALPGAQRERPAERGVLVTLASPSVLTRTVTPALLLYAKKLHSVRHHQPNLMPTCTP